MSRDWNMACELRVSPAEMPSTMLDLEFWPVRVKDVKDVPSSPVSIPPSLGISEPLMRVEILYQPHERAAVACRGSSALCRLRKPAHGLSLAQPSVAIIPEVTYD